MGVPDPDFRLQKQLLLRFITNFTEGNQFKYLEKLHSYQEQELKTVVIDLEDIAKSNDLSDEEKKNILDGLLENSKRYLQLLSEIINEVRESPSDANTSNYRPQVASEEVIF